MTYPVPPHSSEWRVVSYKKTSSLNANAPAWHPSAQSALEETKEDSLASTAKKIIPLRTVLNVHQDDIHTCLRLSDQTFISGSKDGGLKKWDIKGNLIHEVYKPPYINYESWITALSRLGDNLWLSGTRDGYVHSWSLDGAKCEVLQEPLEMDEPSQTHKCKKRNIQRINCLTDFSHCIKDPLTYIAGRPTRFSFHELTGLQNLGHCQTSKNDWVYCVHPININSLLVATGAQLDLWKRPSASFAKWRSQSLVAELPSQQIRPFISAITPLEQKDHFGLAVFDGSVRVYDIARKTLVLRGKEHQKRVWTIENITPFTFASCADDGLIKLWDVRQKFKSTTTIQDNAEEPARVSILLSTEEAVLMSGSCPDDLKHSKNKARFTFWDLRKL